MYCTISLIPFYIVTYYMKCVKTSCTISNWTWVVKDILAYGNRQRSRHCKVQGVILNYEYEYYHL